MKAFLILGACFVVNTASAQQASSPWRVTQPKWTAQHEKQFGEFVAGIGMAVESGKCNRVDTCLKSPANPYYNSDPKGLRYFADCADLPYYLRAYFAWKNGLPMSIVSEVNALGKNSKDIRYSADGNTVGKRYDVLAQATKNGISFPNAIQILNSTIPNYTSSANMRISGTQDSALFSDFYPTKISRSAIRVGTVIYDPNGHVAVVYRVTDDGRIHYIDAHPDNSLTRGMFTPKFSRSKPGQGSGFKNFRPLELVGAQADSKGSLIGGRIVTPTNANLANYGTEQFVGTHPDPGGAWSKGRFFIEGQEQAGFYDFVRMSLMQGERKTNPLIDIAQLTDDICVSLVDRVQAVESARTAKMDQQTHPARLPVNIYGTSGEWEEYSSPSRDARLKVSFVDLLSESKKMLDRYQKRDPTLSYDGGNLAADLLAAYANRALACQFSYTTSNGKTVTLNLEAARQRLFAMSFDPYHCVELRWGARLPEEMASCRDDANKRAWYNQEQWLRNQTERRYDARMDFSLQELTGPLPNVGVAQAPDIDIVGFLKSQK